MGFSLSHYANGYENYGPSYSGGSESENSFTPKVSVSFQADDNNLYYATYAKGFRPGGYNSPLPPGFCAPGLHRRSAFPTGSLPRPIAPTPPRATRSARRTISTTASRSPPASTTSSGTTFSRTSTWRETADCSSPTTWAPRSRRASTCRSRRKSAAGLSVEVVGRLHQRALHQGLAGRPRHRTAMRSQAKAAINYAPGTNPPWTIAIGPQYDFTVMEHDAFVRVDWEYTSRNPWLAPVQDPSEQPVRSGTRTRCPRPASPRSRAGVKSRRLADLGVLRQHVRYAHRSPTTRRGRSTRSIRPGRRRRSRTISPSGRAPSASPQRSRCEPRRCGQAACLTRAAAAGSSHRARRLDARWRP